MKTTLEEYIAGLDLTPEERATVAPILGNQKIVGAINKDLKGAQSEISRQFDAANKIKADVEKSKADYFAEVTTWKQGVDAEMNTVKENARKVFETNAQYKARLESKVADGTLDAEDVADLVKVPAVAAPEVKTVPAQDDRYLSREAYQTDAATQMQLTAAMQDLQAEHFELYGKPMQGAQAMLNKALSEKRPLREVFDETYKITERRGELAAEAQAKIIADARADERMKVMSEVSNPASRPSVGIVSPVLDAFAAKPAEGATHSQRGVQAAVAAFSQGKYRDVAAVK